jgi:hypothetical protein
MYSGADFVNGESPQSRMGISFAGDFAVQLWSVADCSPSLAALIVDFAWSDDKAKTNIEQAAAIDSRLRAKI